MLYFAYGSNLNIAQMQVRCPNTTPLQAFELPDWRLVFRGVLDIVPSPGHAVSGALWSITDECERALDRYEGFPILYIKRRFEIGGMPGLFYVMKEGHRRYSESPPDEGYYSCCAQGFRDWNLPMQRLSGARRRAKNREYNAMLEKVAAKDSEYASLMRRLAIAAR